MKKITIAIPRSKREQVLQFLQEETVIHLTDSNDQAMPEEVEKSDTSYHLAQLQFVLNFIERIKKELNIRNKRGLKNIFASKPMAELPELEDVAQNIQIPSLIDTVQQLNDGLTALDARMEEVRDDIHALEPWTSLNLQVQHPIVKEQCIHLLLEITVQNEALIEEQLLSVPTAVWQVIHRVETKRNTTVYGELIAHADDATAVEAFQEEFDAIVVTLPVVAEESIVGKHEALVREQERIVRDRSFIIEKARKIIAAEQDIQFAYDALLHREERERVSETMRNSSYSTLIVGWIPALWVGLFEKRLSSAFPDVVLETSDPTEQDKVPVLFQNSSLVKPFEAVTDLYGKPAYHEIDPSGPLAIFFLISFGLALTDAGYGIAMMVVTFVAERFLRLKKDMRKMMRLLFFGGAMTVVLGAVTGGWFSINLDALQDGIVKSFLLGVKLLDPLKQPILFLGIIFAFGIVQLLYAWIVRGMHHWKKGEKGVAIIDDFSWAILIGVIILYIGSSRGYYLFELAPMFLWIMYAAIAFMVATQGRTSKNIFLKIGGGVLSLNGLIAFVSDMLSYSRLLALGLATGIIGLVVNLIASMVHESIPVVGVVLAGAVLLVGHVFNLGINALGAFIHSGRLQFVEFFPKFLEGGGVAFRPLGRVGKYVDNPKDFIY